MRRLALLALLWATAGLAAEPTDAPAEPRAWGPAADPPEDARGQAEALVGRRAVPDFDQREAAPGVAEAYALVVPRLLLGPLFVVERYVLYPPVRAFSIWAEKNNIPVRVFRALTLGGPEQHVTFLPTALVDFGFRPSIGVRARGRRIGKVLDFDGHFAWGGHGWWLGQFDGRFAIAARERAERGTPFAGSVALLRFRYLSRPDLVFYGIGTRQSDVRTRYLRTQIGAGAGVELAFGHLDLVRAQVIVEGSAFDPDGRFRDDPDVDDVYDTAAIPGFDSGYTLAGGLFTLELDSRRPRPAPGSGARVAASVLVGQDVGQDLGGQLRVDGEVGLFWDVTGHNHTLGIRQRVGWATSPGRGTVPFSLMPWLGGMEVHRAFKEGALIGPSALVTTFAYTWPTWVFTDGVLFLDIGNVFDEDFEGVSLGAMRMSAGMGMRLWQKRDSTFNLLVAAGSTRFDAPSFKVDAVRFTFGAERGF